MSGILGVDSGIQGGSGSADILTSDTGVKDVSANTQAPDTSTAKSDKDPDVTPADVSVKAGATQSANTLDAASAYEPNYKFKVHDKEHEIDEIFRPIIKDKGVEKRIKELHEKAYGLDYVKQDRESLKSSLAEANEKLQRTDKGLEQLGAYVQNKDYDSFFDALKIPKAEVLAYALEVARREQDPALKQQWETQRQAAFRQQQIQHEQQTFEQERQQFAVQQRSFELNQVLSKPEIADFVQNYDTRIGSPGAFNDFVIQIGQAYAARGEDISAADAVATALKYLQGSPTPVQTQVSSPSASTSKVVAPSNKPVIPNIQGRSTSPVKQAYKSLDDLKQRAKELQAQGQ